MSTVSTAPASSSRRLRRWRRRLDPCVSVLGILVILGAMLFGRELRTQILVTTCGIVLMEVGVWRLAQRLLPSERQYKGYGQDTCKKVSQGREGRLGSDALDDLPHHGPADAAR